MLPYITIAPRFVATPWEFSRSRLGDPTCVVAEGHVVPEPAALSLYQQRWPHRYAVWNGEEQKWDIRQQNPLTGEDELYETLFYWDRQPLDGRPATSAEVNDAVADYLAGRATQEGAGLQECFRPFDLHFVNERIKQAHEWSKIRGTNRVREVTRDRNRQVAMAKFRSARDAWSDFMVDDKRYLPALAAMHGGMAPNEAWLERVPIAAGSPLTVSPNLRTPGDVWPSKAPSSVAA